MSDFNKLKNNRSEFLKATPKDLKRYNLKIEFLIKTFASEENLWEDLSDFSNTNTITQNYRRLLVLAKAFRQKDCKYYKSQKLLDIISRGFEFLHNRVYNKNYETYYGNWWDWELGTPITILNILCLVDLPNQEKYLDVVEFFCPDPRYSMQRANRETITSVGANRVDSVKRAVLMGICKGDKEIISDAISCLFDVLKILDITKIPEITDGFYSDYSFIQHSNIPYTGTYGNVLLSGIAEILLILKDEAEVLLKDNEVIYDIIENSFMPIIYNGYSFDMVNGRGATRENFQSRGFGVEIISSIAMFSIFAPLDYARKFKEFVKYQISKIGFDILEKHIKSTFVLNILRDIYADNGVYSKKPINKTYAYNVMERMICIRDDFTVGISLNSKRIKPYEFMLGENKKGYHSSDGAYYIYTEDTAFDDNYIATLNPNRIPGTTIFDEKYEDGAMENPQKNAISNVLSVSNFYGVSCIELNKENGLFARKSFFVLDDKIVALGSKISKNTKTIVDTKKYKSKPLVFNDFYYIDGTAYFSKDKIEVCEYEEKRSFFDINDHGSKKVLSQKYNSLIINHEKADEYAYIIAPKMPLEDVENYAKNIDIEILENSSEIHAIKYKNMTFINFWSKGKYDLVETNAPISVCIIENDYELDVTLSDTSKEFDKITVKINENEVKLHRFETKNIKIRK